MPGFDLVSRPWLPVQLSDGTAAELSLKEVFARAADIRRLVGDLPTQEFALMRLLLAILHDAVDGPEDIDAWQELSESPQPFAAVGPYLDRHRERFDLLHPTQPFMQVAGLRTQKDEVASLNRLVADVPNGDPFFTMRQPGVETLSFSEAARWLVHAHAFDTSGIKSGAVGDPRVKGGKGYPQGVGWAGNLGGVFAEGDSLQQTLLLNLVACDASGFTVDKDDRPAWRRNQCEPHVQNDLASRPTGPRDLYTWQSRRIRLHHDDLAVHGVVLCYGDPLPVHNSHQREPMSGWRRSIPQEKKLKEPRVYMPRGHDPARSAWRSLDALLTSRTEEQTVQGTEPARYLRAGVLKWIAELTHERLLPRDLLIRPRLIGAVYGTQQSVIDEVVDDSIAMSVVLLHERDPKHAQAAIAAVEDGTKAVRALGDLAADLARTAGRPTEAPGDTARDLGFGLLDGPYRKWIVTLDGSHDPLAARTAWQRTTYRIIRNAASDLLAGDADATGWLDNAKSERVFHARLSKALPLRHDTPPDAATPGEQADPIKETVR